MESYKNILCEGKRDELLSRFLPLFNERGISITISHLKQMLLKKLVNEGRLHNLSLGSNFYLLGVSRFYFEGILTNCSNIDELGIFSNSADNFDINICQKLNKVILLARNHYIEHYIESNNGERDMDENFNNLSLEELFNYYSNEIGDVVDDKDVEEYDANDNTCGDYTFDIMYSYADCQEYNAATEPGAWCITYGLNHYNCYIDMFKHYGGIHYVVFRRNDYENTPRKVGKNYPCDDYGNSLICVLQRNDCPKTTYITSRWNHGGYDSPDCEADHAYSEKEFLSIIGDNGAILEKVYHIWKKNNKDEDNAAIINKEKILNYKYSQILLDGGGNLSEIFNKVEVISGDIKKYKKGICQVSLDEGRTWCMCVKGKLICNKISIGKIQKYNLYDDGFLDRYYGENDDYGDGYCYFIINNKYNCYLDYDDIVHNVTLSVNFTVDKLMDKLGMNTMLKNNSNHTYAIYNTLNNKFWQLYTI